MTKIFCPYVYADGKACGGHVVRIEAYKADLEWDYADGGWRFASFPRSHYHLYCSEKGDHVGHKRRADDRMKFFLDQLPDNLRAVIVATDVLPESGNTSVATMTARRSSGNHDSLLLPGFQPMTQLGCRRCFTRSLQTGHENDSRWLH